MSITESADLPELREYIRARRATLAGFMEQGASLTLDGDVLRVIPRNDIYIRYLNDNRAAIGELASELYGCKLRVEVSLNGAAAPPAAGATLAETGLPAEREHVLTADDKTDFVVEHWKGQLIRQIGEVDARYRPTDAAGLAEALMQFALGPDAPREVKRPAELKTLADEEVAGIFADLASRAWGERTSLPASPASGAVVVSPGRRAPGLRTVRDY